MIVRNRSIQQTKVLHIAELFGSYKLQNGKFEMSQEASTVFGNLFDEPSIWPESFVIFNGEENVKANFKHSNTTEDEDAELISCIYESECGTYKFEIWND